MTSLAFPLVISTPPSVDWVASIASGVPFNSGNYISAKVIYLDPTTFTSSTTATLSIAPTQNSSYQFTPFTVSIPITLASSATVANENIAIHIPPANLLSQAKFPLYTNMSSPTWALGTTNTINSNDPANSLPGLSIDNTNAQILFTPTQYGFFYVTLTASGTFSGSPSTTPAKTFIVKVIPDSPYTLVDGQLIINTYGTEPTPAKRSLNLTINDSTTSSLQKSIPITVNNPIAGIVLNSSDAGYWIENDPSIKVLGISGDMDGTYAVSGTPVTASNGLQAVTSVDASGNATMTIAGPPSSNGYGASSIPVSIPLANNYGSLIKNIETIALNATDDSLGTFTFTLHTSTFKVGDRVAFSPLRPHSNSTLIFKNPSYVARVKSGTVLPPGLSLDQNTGLIYGPVVGTPVSGSWTTIEYFNPSTPTVVAGSIDIYFDIVASYQTLVDNLETLTSVRTLNAGNSISVDFINNTIVRYDKSWGTEGVAPTKSTPLPTLITLSSFASNNGIVEVSGVTDITSPSFSSSLAIGTGTLAPANKASGTMTVQTFLRSATASGAVFSSVSLYSGYLPGGLELQVYGDTVVITGIPDEFGVFNPVIAATDNNGKVSYWSPTVVIPFYLPLEITTTSNQIPILTKTNPISFQLMARGGTGGYTWSVSPTSPQVLPSGVLLATNGILSGSYNGQDPNNTTYQVEFIVTDSEGVGEAATLTLTFDNTLTITTTAIPSFIPNKAGSYQLAARGGTPPYSWGLAQGQTLPTGITISNGGLVSFDGLGEQISSTNIIFQVTDNATVTATKSLNVQAQSFPGNFTFTSNLPSIKRGWTYSGSLTVSGGAGGYSWFESGLPTGILAAPSSTANNTLLFSGSTISSASTASISIDAIDSANYYKVFPANVPIVKGVTLTTQSLPTGVVGKGYLLYGDPYTPSGLPISLQATVGPALKNNLTFSGSGLPTGMIVNANTGQIFGTPSAVFNNNVTVSANDSVDTDSKTLNLTIISTTLTITTSSLPMSLNAPVSITLQATGGGGAYTWGLTSYFPQYHLPPGISLTNGVISGTPTQQGTFPVSIQVTDALGASAYKGFLVTVGSPLQILTGPDYTNSSSTNYLGYIRSMTPGTTINPRPSGSFMVYAVGMQSTSISQISMSVPSPFTATTVSLANGTAVFSISNVPTSQTTGDQPITVVVHDGPTIVTATLNYKVVPNTLITMALPVNRSVITPV